MAKFHGPIGFGIPTEVKPGVWKDKLSNRLYSGDIIQIIKKTQSAGQVNDDVNVTNKISIIADPYATNNLQSIKYVEFLGAKWKVTDVSVEYPRLILTIGGVFNGK